jgi:hypothetical protein
MITVETLLEAINMNMDIDGYLISLDVKKDDEDNPVEIIIRSTQFNSPTEEELIEVVIDKNGATKKVLGKLKNEED